MGQYEEALRILLEAVQKNMAAGETGGCSGKIPVGISNRHVHLSRADADLIFGSGYEFTKGKELSQPGQYACKETVTICGPKGAIEKVRILGPVRSKTQVEIMAGDSFKLGVVSEPRLSGDLHGTPGITLIGPKGSVQIKEGVIIAQRHIHMLPGEARQLGVQDGQLVRIKIGGARGGIYDHVAIRANDASALECHLDMEEANAMNINPSTDITIVK